MYRRRALFEHVQQEVSDHEVSGEPLDIMIRCNRLMGLANALFTDHRAPLDDVPRRIRSANELLEFAFELALS